MVGRCDGVPFYIEQVVAGLSETGVPEALYEPLFARLRASANVVPVVEAAAVIGRQMDRGLLCSVVDLSDDEVDDVIDELEDALVLEPWGTDSWRFRHELLREVAAELAPPSVRRGCTPRWPTPWSAERRDPDWRLVAAHYERAERFDEAASAYQQASTDARRRGALAEARTYLTHALAQLDRATPGPDRDRREMAARLERGSSPRPRRAIKAAPPPPTSSGACSWPAPTCATTSWSATLVALTATTSRVLTCAGRPRCSSRCARASSRAAVVSSG